MEIRQLEYFLAVVDNGGVAGASALLSVAPPTVSAAVSTLETELGVRLFHRLDRGMKPSSAGYALIGPAREVVRAARGLTAEIDSAPGDLTGTVVFGVFAPLAGSALSDVVIRLRRAHPRVRVRIVSLDRPAIGAADQLASGHVDFLFTHLPMGVDGLAELPLGVHEMVVAFPVEAGVPPGPVDLGNLPPVPMVLAPATSYAIGEAFAAMLGSGSRQPDVGVVMGPREGWLPLVEAGVCGAIFERTQVDDLPPGVDVHEVVQAPGAAYGLVYDPRRLDAAGRAVVEVAGR